MFWRKRTNGMVNGQANSLRYFSVTKIYTICNWYHNLIGVTHLLMSFTFSKYYDLQISWYLIECLLLVALQLYNYNWLFVPIWIFNQCIVVCKWFQYTHFVWICYHSNHMKIYLKIWVSIIFNNCYTSGLTNKYLKSGRLFIFPPSHGL
jgi:hypothetical protein